MTLASGCEFNISAITMIGVLARLNVERRLCCVQSFVVPLTLENPHSRDRLSIAEEAESWHSLNGRNLVVDVEERRKKMG